jgi:hypothetical protein
LCERPVNPTLTCIFNAYGRSGFSALISGILIAIFLYSGWDTAAYVGEEARGKQAGPAAITSVVLLFVMYSVVILVFQGIAPDSKIQANAGNVLAYVGRLIGGGFWADVMIVTVLGGTLASLQAAIVSASRIGYAMGRDRVFPTWFGRTHDRHQTPTTRYVSVEGPAGGHRWRMCRGPRPTQKAWSSATWVKISGADVWTTGQGAPHRRLGALKGASAGVFEPPRSRIGVRLSSLLLGGDQPKKARLYVASADGPRYERLLLPWVRFTRWEPRSTGRFPRSCRSGSGR